MPVCWTSLICASWSDCQTQDKWPHGAEPWIGRKMQATIFKFEEWNGLIKSALFIGMKNVVLICGWHMIIRFLRISWICFATDITQMALALLNQGSNFKIWYRRKRQTNRPSLWAYSGPKNIPLQLHGWAARQFTPGASLMEILILGHLHLAKMISIWKPLHDLTLEERTRWRAQLWFLQIKGGFGFRPPSWTSR